MNKKKEDIDIIKLTQHMNKYISNATNNETLSKMFDNSSKMDPISPIVENRQTYQPTNSISLSNLVIKSIQTVKNINGSLYAIINYLLNGIQSTSLIQTKELQLHYPKLLITYYESKIKYD